MRMTQWINPTSMNNTIQLILGVIDCSVSLITLGWLHRPKLGFLLRWKYSEWLWIVNDPLVLIWSDWLLPNSTFPRFRVPWSRFLVDWEFFEARVHPLVVCPLISLLESGSMVDPLHPTGNITESTLLPPGLDPLEVVICWWPPLPSSSAPGHRVNWHEGRARPVVD